MKNLALLSSLALILGLFAIGPAFGAGNQKSDYGQGKSGSTSFDQQQKMERQGPSSSMTEQTRQRTTAQQLNREQVRELQRLLNEEGFTAGPEDGIIGPKTRGALRDFQNEEGIAANGNPNEETLRALAPSTEKQEFFGLSPEFGEQFKQERQERMGTEQSPLEQQHKKQTPEGSNY